ncbi:hypothetical protein LPN04_09630 [Rugamonas sp. A1-17]|nr:hypothetical protein [Rugamonas sp. A1-17]
MKNNSLEQRVQRWADEFSATGDLTKRDAIKRLLHQLSFLDGKLYYSYEPSRPPNESYLQRLQKWLDNLETDADQQAAFKLAAELFYVGTEELEGLQRAAYTGPIRRWLVEQANLSLSDVNLSEKIKINAAATWFCPITDSMKINEFIHLNNIKNGINERPEWQSLAEFGDVARINKYIVDNGIERIVLLEDFIATGSQAVSAIKFASKLRNKCPIPILVVPLIFCPKARQNFLDENFPPHVSVVPVLQLEKNHFISDVDIENSAQYLEVKQLADATYLKVSDGVAAGQKKPYGPLGFQSTGGLIVLCTNTPDNTLPLVHWSSRTWTPLFPRHSRI